MKFISVPFLITVLCALSFCSKKNSGTGPDNSVPTNLTVTATVSTDSSGNVSFVSTATNAVSYDYDFGNGVLQTVASGSVTYKYSHTGSYTVTVSAKSASGGAVSKAVIVSVALPFALVWDEEFNTDGAPDPLKWGYDIGGGGWGNNELENYTNRSTNAVVSSGTLKITALSENYGGNSYTSARLLSKDKFSFQYGRIEVRAKLPGGAGTWPAIWMLGSNISTAGWPACGEVDIMEEKGSDPDKIYSTLHYPGHSGANGDGRTTVISNATTSFHKYSAAWSPSSITFSIDDQVFYTFTNSPGLPFNQNFFIILNLALGGNFGGAIDPAFSSATMEVDYVRVYQ